MLLLLSNKISDFFLLKWIFVPLLLYWIFWNNFASFSLEIFLMVKQTLNNKIFLKVNFFIELKFWVFTQTNFLIFLLVFLILNELWFQIFYFFFDTQLIFSLWILNCGEVFFVFMRLVKVFLKQIPPLISLKASRINFKVEIDVQT